MIDIVTTIAEKSGISPAMVQKGLGAILTALKKFAPDLHSQVAGYLPQSGQYESSLEASQESGGLMGAITGAASKLFGGQTGETAEVANLFSKAGFSTDQVSQFLPAAIEQLKNVVPADVIDGIVERFPALQKLQ